MVVRGGLISPGKQGCGVNVKVPEYHDELAGSFATQSFAINLFEKALGPLKLLLH